MHAKPFNFLQLLNGNVQYIVPYWQRRYCWQASDIERLVEDLLTVAEAPTGSTHYTGNLLTFEELQPAGVLTSRYNVVDGQQRLTTVSILLACIAKKLERDGPYEQWIPENILPGYLTNPSIGSVGDMKLKLKLQSADADEYRNGLSGMPQGSGAVTQAWRIAQRLVENNNTTFLIKGLERLRVVSIALDPTDDPQQIFESLNATGRSLTEGEKVKNWLLLGSPIDRQQHIYEKYWLEIEKNLGAEDEPKSVDVFLRDVMRYRTGELTRSNRTYEQFRRWALKEGYWQDKSELCCELARLAKLYGLLTGSSGEHGDKRVAKELKHLRELGFDVHRPFTLRLLDETSRSNSPLRNDELTGAVGCISSWLTRLWLSHRPTNALSRAMLALASGAGPTEVGEGYASYWIDRISGLRNQSIGVPGDEEVRAGISSREAYGGAATRATFAILSELVNKEHEEKKVGEVVLKDPTIEHIMPQKLTSKWRQYLEDLGENADDLHDHYCNKLANLTICSSPENLYLGGKPFKKKRCIYKDSAIRMTRCLGYEDKWREWNKNSLETRADELTCRALDCWSWEREGTMGDRSRGKYSYTWQINGSTVHNESVGSQMVLNVAATLLSRNPSNAEKLSGNAITTNIHPASKYPPDVKVGASTMRGIPGHPNWVIHPYKNDILDYAEFCKEIGTRCGVEIYVEVLFDQNYHFISKVRPTIRIRRNGTKQAEAFINISVAEAVNRIVPKEDYGKWKWELRIHHGKWTDFSYNGAEITTRTLK